MSAKSSLKVRVSLSLDKLRCQSAKQLFLQKDDFLTLQSLDKKNLVVSFCQQANHSFSGVKSPTLNYPGLITRLLQYLSVKQSLLQTPDMDKEITRRTIRRYVPAKDIITMLKNKNDKILRAYGYCFLMVGDDHHNLRVTVTSSNILMGLYCFKPVELGLAPSSQ